MKARTLSLLVILAATQCLAQNPFITTIYTADPSAHVWSDGRLYVYPSHDMDPAKGCDLMDRYHVYSTDDMVSWRDEGEILNASEVAWGRKEGGFMWAPDAAYKNGKYYFYFPHPSESQWNNSWKIGVATSDKPASDFKSAGFIEGLGGHAMIDPSVFVDTDGKAYFYYGGGAKCQGGRMKDNMMEIDGEMKTMEGLVDFHEAAWVFKRNGVYYLAYADNNPKQNQLRYATSSNPLGPWKSEGVFLGITGCDTNHGSMVEYKGKWYIFYHNQAISNTGKGNLRSICVDELNFNADGTIRLVKQTTTGVPSIKAKPTPPRKGVKYEAETATLNAASVVTAETASGKKYVNGMEKADASIEFRNVEGLKNGGRVTISVYHSAPAYARVRLFVNGKDQSYLNAIATGADADFKGRAYFTIKLDKGKTNSIKLVGGTGGVNIDYITITPVD